MGLPGLPDPIHEKLAAYQGLLAKWNSKINLTAHRSEESSLEKNFLDSLALLPLIPIGNIMDFGSGAGFPGLVLKISRPEISMTLVESDRRKSVFLETIVRELALQKTHVANLFLDSQKAKEMGWEGRFDGLVSRATMAIGELLPVGALCLKSGGVFLGMATENQEDLTLPPSISLGGESTYELPFSKISRRILLFKKISSA